MYILFAILIFSFLIFVHELGHFITAKLSGVQVNEFSMFMGPAIIKKQKGETLYSIRCIPLGGYCAMEGEDEESDNPRAFTRAKWWKRVIILVAGAAMNFVAGFLMVVIVNSFAVQIIPQVASLRTGSTLAWEGGLQVGDTILEMNGQAVDSTLDFSAILEQDPSVTQFDVLVERDGQKVLLEDVTMIPQEFEKNEEGEAGTFYGVGWGSRPLSFGEIIAQSWNDCVYFVKLVWMSLGMLLSGEAGIQDMSGPAGIVSIMNETAQQAGSTLDAVLNILFLGGFIAVNLGVMNLLPIPALDGGRVAALLITTAYERITKKKLNPKYEGYVHAVGMILLLALMAFITFKDIITIFQ